MISILILRTISSALFAVFVPLFVILANPCPEDAGLGCLGYAFVYLLGMLVILPLSFLVLWMLEKIFTKKRDKILFYISTILVFIVSLFVVITNR